MKIIGVSGAKTWNRFASLRPGGGVFGVSVGDAADFRELIVEDEMSGKIGGGSQMAIDDFAGQIGDDEMVGSQVFIGNSTGFDDD